MDGDDRTRLKVDRTRGRRILAVRVFTNGERSENGVIETNEHDVV